MRVWITSSNDCRLFLEYDIHLDDSFIPDKQVTKLKLISNSFFLLKKETVTKGNNTLWLEIFGYRFTENDDNDKILPIQPKQRTHSTISYAKLSIIR
jgi:hypothetical protein